jgi:hypothetical protein
MELEIPKYWIAFLSENALPGVSLDISKETDISAIGGGLILPKNDGHLNEGLVGSFEVQRAKIV